MKTPFDEKMNEVNIPESLDQRISMGFDRAKLESGMDRNRMKKRFTTIAASLAITFLALGIIGFDNVGAAIREALKYVPGFNVLVEKQDGDIYILPKQLEVRDGDRYLKLTAAARIGDILHIRMESNHLVEPGKEAMEVNFEDIKIELDDAANGTGSVIRGWARGSGGSLWSQDMEYKVDPASNAFTLAVDDLSIDFTLVASRGVDALEDLGSYAKDQGITIVGLMEKLEDRIRVDLISNSENGTISSYPLGGETTFVMFGEDSALESLHLVDAEGNKTFPNLPSSYGNLLSEFYFRADPTKDYRLVLPYMVMQYPELESDKITLKTPAFGETIPINKSLKLGKFTVDFLSIKRIGDEVTIKLASEPVGSEVLAFFHLKGVSGYGSSYAEPEGPILIFSYKDIGEKFSFRLTRPESILKGDWVIDLAK
jgi:hypothetical protein